MTDKDHIDEDSIFDDHIDEDSFFDDHIDEDTSFDDHIQEDSSIDDSTNKDSFHQEPVKKKISFQKRHLEKGGQKLLLFVTCLSLAGLAAPSVLIYLFKSPQPEQHMLVFGVSYYKFLFIFFLGASLITYCAVFFLMSNSLMILMVFLLSLFCCFPLVLGLHNNLTLTQAIIDIPYFSSWPFFLNPAYILIEFLIPAGIIIYLILQLKNIFSRKQHTYAFFCAALYLGVAAFLGFSALTQAGQPNIVSLFEWGKGNTEHFPLGKNERPDTNNSLVPQVVNSSVQQHVNQDLKPLSVSTVEDLKAKAEFNQGLQRVSEKLDRILEALTRKNSVTPMSLKNATKAAAEAETSQHPDVKLDLNPIAELRTSHLPEKKISQELQQISGKLARIADELSGLETILSKPSEFSQKTSNVAKEPQDARPHPEETAKIAPPTEKKEEEEISQRLRRLSAKVEQIWEMLTHEEIIPKETTKSENK